MIYLSLAGGILIIGVSPVLLKWAGAPGPVSSFYRMALRFFDCCAALFLPHPARQKPAHPQRCDLCRVGRGLLFTRFEPVVDRCHARRCNHPHPAFQPGAGIGWHRRLAVSSKKNNHLSFWAGLIVAVVGSVLVLNQDLNISPQIGLGAILGLLSALFYGLYYLATQGGRASLDTVSYFWITATSAAVMMLLANIVLRQPLTGYSLTTNLSFLAMGLLVQVGGWLLINFAQGYLSASVVAATLLIQPLITGIFANIVLAETFTTWHLIGGTAVLVGVFIVHFSRDSRRKPEQTLAAVE